LFWKEIRRSYGDNVSLNRKRKPIVDVTLMNARQFYEFYKLIRQIQQSSESSSSSSSNAMTKGQKEEAVYLENLAAEREKETVADRVRIEERKEVMRKEMIKHGVLKEEDKEEKENQRIEDDIKDLFDSLKSSSSNSVSLKKFLSSKWLKEVLKNSGLMLDHVKEVMKEFSLQEKDSMKYSLFYQFLYQLSLKLEIDFNDPASFRRSASEDSTTGNLPPLVAFGNRLRQVSSSSSNPSDEMTASKPDGTSMKGLDPSLKHALFTQLKGEVGRYLVTAAALFQCFSVFRSFPVLYVLLLTASLSCRLSFVLE
jgi:hypothetical protein